MKNNVKLCFCSYFETSIPQRTATILNFNNRSLQQHARKLRAFVGKVFDSYLRIIALISAVCCRGRVVLIRQSAIIDNGDELARMIYANERDLFGNLPATVLNSSEINFWQPAIRGSSPSVKN